MNCSTRLYEHQQKAVDKIARSRVGALFMEMGTGKTRTAIELVALRQARISNVVWFCPVSLKATIAHEIVKHTDTPTSDICVFDDKSAIGNLPRAMWYIVGIESMSSSDRVTLTTNSIINAKSFVIVDESSYIKGHSSRRTLRITRLSERARYRLVLTGTPLSQGVVDLYAQMRFLSPKILGYRSFYSFAANHLEYSEKFPDMIVRSHNIEYLAAKIHPYVYQVTKNECLTLPSKIYEQRYYSMTRDQRYYYEQAKEEFLELAEEQIDSYAIFKLFNALQQIVSGYWNRWDRYVTFNHSRLDVLSDIINDIPEDAKVIIWCKYMFSISAIVEMLAHRYSADAVAQFHGSPGEAERQAEIERFRDTARFFVATMSSGGHGLTLNEAHHVIFYENEFKYAHRLQAEDRCHRIGQERKVTYIDIVCNGSIDERIMEAIDDKGNAAASFKRQVDKVKDKSKSEMKKLVMGL